MYCKLTTAILKTNTSYLIHAVITITRCVPALADDGAHGEKSVIPAAVRTDPITLVCSAFIPVSNQFTHGLMQSYSI